MFLIGRSPRRTYKEFKQCLRDADTNYSFLTGKKAKTFWGATPGANGCRYQVPTAVIYATNSSPTRPPMNTHEGTMMDLDTITASKLWTKWVSSRDGETSQQWWLPAMRCDEAQDPPVLIPAPCMPKTTPANECGDGSRKKRRPVGKLRAPDQNRDQEQKREVLEEWTEFAEQEKKHWVYICYTCYHRKIVCSTNFSWHRLCHIRICFLSVCFQEPLSVSLLIRELSRGFNGSKEETKEVVRTFIDIAGYYHQYLYICCQESQDIM